MEVDLEKSNNEPESENMNSSESSQSDTSQSDQLLINSSCNAKTNDRPVLPGNGPGYGQFSYSSPSDLLMKSENQKANNGLAKDQFSHTIPSEFIGKTNDKQGISEQNLSPTNSQFSYTTPSKVLNQYEEGSENKRRSSYSSQFTYPTPSELLKKIEVREARDNNRPSSSGVGIIKDQLSYTTPSELNRSQENKEKSLSCNQLTYATPSELLKKTEVREARTNRPAFPGVGLTKDQFSYTTPSQLLNKISNRADNSQQNLSLINSQFSYTTPSELLNRSGENAEKENSSDSNQFTYSTPSELLKKTEVREARTNHRSALPGVDLTRYQFSYTTPSELLNRSGKNAGNEERSSGCNQYTYVTPSDLLKKTEEPEVRTNYRSAFPGVDLTRDQFSYTTPSELLKKTEEQEVRTNYRSALPGVDLTRDQFSYTTPSELLNKIGNRKSEEASPQYFAHGQFSHTTSPGINKKSGEREPSPKNTGYYELDYAMPSERKQDNYVPSNQSNKLQLHVSKTSPGYEFFRTSLVNIGKSDSVNHPTDKGCIGYGSSSDVPSSSPKVIGSGTSVDCSDYLSFEKHLMSESSFHPRLLDWHTQSDITCYFKDISNVFQNAASLSTTISEPWFMQIFLSAVASSLYETSNTDETSCEKLTSGQSSTGISKIDFLDELTQYLHIERSFGCSGTTVFPNESTTTYEISDMSLADRLYSEESLDEHTTVRLASSASFNKLFWSLYNVDPKLALITIGSNSRMIPPALRRLTKSEMSNSSLFRNQSGCAGVSSFSEDDLKKRMSADNQKKLSSVSSADIRTMQLEKESFEGQVRKLSIENSTLLGENKLIKQKFDTATARINDLEDKLKVSQDAMDNLERNMNIEISEVCRKNRSELEYHLKEQKNKFGSLDKENEILKTEINSLEKQVSGVKKEADYLRTSGDKNKTLEAYMRESELLMQEVDKLKELLKQSERQVHDLTSRQSESTNQLIQVCKVRDMLQQQLETGGSLAEKQSLREMKSDFESRIRQMEEKIEDIRSEKQSIESLYKEQLSSLTKERHNAFGKLKTLHDMMDAIRTENEALRQSLKSGLSSKDSSMLVDETEVNRLAMELHSFEDIVGELNRTVKQQTMELETAWAQLDSRNKSLNDANAELSILASRVSLDDTSVRKQQKIDRLSTQINSLQSEMKKLTEKCGIYGAENSHLEQQLDNANRQLHNARQQTEAKANEQLEMKISFLQSELEQKDSQAEKATNHYKQTESSLQKLRQELFYHQEHSNNVQAQVDSYHHQLDQKIHLLDTVTKSEKEKLNQIEVLKDTLDSMTSRLNKRQAELQISQLEFSRAQDVNDKLQLQLQQANTDHPPPKRSPSATELQISHLNAEIDKLKSDLLQVTSALNASITEYEESETKLSKVRQQLTDEKSKIVQISADRTELQQQVQTIGEERDVLFEEKTVDEEDLVKLESKLQQVLRRFQEDTLQHHQHQKYKQAQDTSQLLSEINSLTMLLDGKDRELEMFNDKQHRNQIELTFLHKRVEYLANENQCSKEDIDRLTNELIFKMKENSTTYEVNEYLTKEKSYQQKEIIHLQKDLLSEKDYIHKMKKEINSVLQKLDQSEIGQQSTVAEIMTKDGKIASLETELRHMESNNRQLENELIQNRSRMDHMNEDIRNLTNMKSTLENQLAAERNSLEVERSVTCKKKDEMEQTSQKLEAVKHEQSFLLNNLSSERNNQQLLKEEIVQKELTEHRLSSEVNDLKKENTKLQVQLSDCRTLIDQIKKEQTTATQEQFEVNSMLREKDREISELREREMVMNDTIRREVAVEKANFDQEKSVTIRELQVAKDEVNGMTEKLKQKDLQLNSFGRTLQEMEDLKRKKIELESKMEKCESSAGDGRMLIESQRKEVMSLRQENSKLQESFAKSQVNSHTLQDELRIIKESTSQQIYEVKNSSAYQKDQNEAEKYMLREALAKSEANLRATENTLQTITESKLCLQTEYKALEYSLGEIKTRLTTEITERKLAEQRADNTKSNLDEIKQNKFGIDEKLLEVQALLTKSEGDVNTQKDKVKKLLYHNQELEAMVQVNDSAIRAKQEQIEILQGELTKLRQMMDAQKQQLNTKLRKFTLEQKLQLENIQQEKQNVAQQAMQLSVDLEQSREHVATKNKENLKLQEDILSLEEQKRDMHSELRLSRDSLKSEEDMQTKLVTRYTEQEEELKRLRTMWSKQAEEAGEDDSRSMWKKMNQVIQDLSQQMQSNLDNQQQKEKETREREAKVVHRYRKQSLELQSQLNTERALHQITKNSLRALEEDCARLRQLMHSVRRKSGSPDKKQKSRIEEINEIIVRSQTQAQSMMASGAYLDTSLKNICPSRDYNINSNRDGSRSPDTCSQLSDCSFGSAACLNTSFVNMSGTFQPESLRPRK